MFTLLRSLTVSRLVLEQLPAFIISFIIAEMFYKFHSFSLETGAFLLTWFVVDALIQFFVGLLRPKTNKATFQKS